MKYVMRYPDWKSKALTLSYDDAVSQDIRLIDIMSKNGLKGTFNINAGMFGVQGTSVHRRMDAHEAIKLYKESGNEVAVHTYEHIYMSEPYVANLTHQVLKDREEIEKLTGTIIRGMAYPYGFYCTDNAENVINSLKACGIAYARMTGASEKFSLPENWLKLVPTCHHNNPRLTELFNAFMNIRIPADTKNRVMRPCTMFYLWGHSYEFDNDNNWEVIESFAKLAGGHDDIWYATNIEIYDYVMAYRQLRFNVEATMVHNPTSTDIYFATDLKDYVVKAGETISLCE
ncbi:MAG: polysaccharide deacetylase [Ruminococcaceae bacterium]|nr:polysaccharide deacetylase [Oscillospiraceae bacterium]